MKIILIGYRGTGKSSVGARVAQKLGWEFLSTDTEIIKRASCSIPDIVAKFGWDHFRDLESAVCRDMADQDRVVLDTGGGVILRHENMKVLKPESLVFWLTASVSTISKRIEKDTQRPALTQGRSFIEEIEEVLQERTPLYQAAADYIIPTDDTPIDSLADRIVTTLQPSN